jgi:orotidine-5'-phosphate decarboxylase
MRANTELIVALDYSKPEPARALVSSLEGLPVLYKVGLELFTVAGPEFVRELTRARARIFLDLKFHDIPNTVAKAARQAAQLHVEMFTLHLSGGKAMIQAVRDELSEIESLRPKILGVTVLTSFDEVHWAQVTEALAGRASTPAVSVAGLVSHATSWGCDGVVCSAHELEDLRSQAPGLYTVVPGIRPAGTDAGDQARVMTPSQARRAGADAVVVGRPITQAADPRRAVETILAELGSS